MPFGHSVGSRFPPFASTALMKAPEIWRSIDAWSICFS